MGFSTTLRNLSVGFKILAIVGVCMAGLVAVASVSIYQMARIGSEIEAITEQDIPLTGILTAITVHQLEQAISFERAARYGEAMARDPQAGEQFRHARETFEELAAKVDGEVRQGEALAADAVTRAHSPAEADEFRQVLESLKTIEREHGKFDAHTLEVLGLLEAGRIAEAVEKEKAIEHEIEPLDHELEALLAEISAFTAKASKTAEAHEKFGELYTGIPFSS